MKANGLLKNTNIFSEPVRKQQFIRVDKIDFLSKTLPFNVWKTKKQKKKIRYN